MKQNNLFDLIQNSAVSVIALQSFTLGYHNVAKHKDNIPNYPKLEYMFYVLPIVYNNESMETIRSSNELYTALIKDTSMILGLQDRANKMSIQTFDGLNLAFGKKILGIQKDSNTIELLHGFRSKKMTLMLSMNTSMNSVKLIQDCAFKLGGLFAKRNEKNIQIELNIRF